MNMYEIALNKLNAAVVPAGDSDNYQQAMALNGNLMGLGYVMSQDLTNAVSKLDERQLGEFESKLVSAARKQVGANVRYRPMYPNFPAQVAEASDYELLANALMHYWSLGTWMPEYNILEREYKFEGDKLRVIKLANDVEFNSVFTKILGSADSISETDKQILEWFCENRSCLLVPDEIPHKENMAVFAAIRLRRGFGVGNLVKTGTDVMRIHAYLSGGDVSLAEKVKFKSLPKKFRRALTAALQDSLNDEDLKRRPNEFVRMGHSLHVGDFSTLVHTKLRKVRENEQRKTLKSFNGKVEIALKTGDIAEAVNLLKQRPGEFARRISELLDKNGDDAYGNTSISAEFAKVVDKIPTRVLAQLWGYLNSRLEDQESMFVTPKGSISKAVIVKRPQYALPDDVIEGFTQAIEASLVNRFKGLNELGKVWIDPQLKAAPLPTQMRSASESMRALARGTRVPFGDKSTLRFFIYWKGQDIDLSASFHGADFEYRDHVSYTRLRDHRAKSYHSGDVTYAPNGASEFIDVDIESALKAGHRYVMMNVYVFSGPNFADHEICYAGWMTRDHVNSNEIYDPKTVQQKSDLTSQSRNAIPVVFDLENREAIWLDMATRERGGYNFGAGWGNTGIRVQWRGGNNIEANKATSEDMLKFYVSRRNKISLYDLFRCHATARGELVENREDADYVFAFDGDTTPYDVMDINAEFVRD